MNMWQNLLCFSDEDATSSFTWLILFNLYHHNDQDDAVKYGLIFG